MRDECLSVCWVVRCTYTFMTKQEEGKITDLTFPFIFCVIWNATNSKIVGSFKKMSLKLEGYTYIFFLPVTLRTSSNIHRILMLFEITRIWKP